MDKTIHRIIDANFNRSREACRVIEEFCRFALDRKELTSRIKQIRHKLSAASQAINADKMIAARDSDKDVGRALSVDGQLSRKSLCDCFTAAAKRLTESLRALAEATQTFDPQTAQTFEALRFETYTLEKDIALTADARIKFDPVNLYVLITATADDADEKILTLTQQCTAADCIQLRAKGMTDRRLLSLAERFVEICKSAGVVSIINDNPHIAIASGADGVHVGQDDMPIEAVRKLTPRPMIIGLSTHNPGQLRSAIAQNADYIALGPAFDTQTKPHEKTAGLEYIKTATAILKEQNIPAVTIGGITLDNIDQTIAAGATKLAICSAITHATDPAAQCLKFKTILDKS